MRLFVSALLTATVLSAAATANPYGNYQQPRGDNWPNWYIGLHGEYSFITDADVTIGGTGGAEVEFDDNYAAGVSVGYRPYYSGTAFDYTRWELEYTYRGGDLDALTSAGASTTLDGDISAHAFMANAFFDIKTDTSFHPYVGAGIGLVQFQADSGALGLDDSTSSFGYQGMLGVTYVPQALPDTEWTLGYRYFGATDPEFTNGAGVTIEHDYNAHSLEAGARFRF